MLNVDGLRKLWSGGLDWASFSGETNFKRRSGISTNVAQQEIFPYLSTYTRFRAAKRPRIYNPYFTRLIRKNIQSDLLFMDRPREMVAENDGYRYILIVQDIFSRKVWGRALKNKQAEHIVPQLRSILEDMAPFASGARFIIDRGTEYLNARVRALLNEHGLSITHPSDGHASHVERANLSLQRLLFQRMTEKGGAPIWTDYLEQALENMNRRYHRIIKMSPAKAERPENADKVNEAMALYRIKATSTNKKKKARKYKIGDMVRLQRSKNIFNRGYQPTFGEEVFKIRDVLNHLPLTMYELEEWDGSDIDGNFYPEELSLVKGDIFKVEEVIRRGIRNGVPSALVKWAGFDQKYNSWVPVSDISQSQ